MDPPAVYSIHMPNMAEKAKQEVGFAKREIRSYLGNGSVVERNGRKFGPYICQIWPKKPNRKLVPPNRKLVPPNRKLGPILETGSIYTAYICQIRQKKLNRKLVPPNRKKQEV